MWQNKLVQYIKLANQMAGEGSEWVRAPRLTLEGEERKRISAIIQRVKNPFLEQLGGGDRLFNRTLGRASYQAIWSLVRDAPAGVTYIVDAWFGFQPSELLVEHLKMAGVEATAEVWCHAPGEVLGERYAARLDERLPGHPGADYILELIELAKRATPLKRGPLLDVDTTKALDFDAIVGWVRTALTTDD